MPQPVDLQTEMARVAAAERIQQFTDRLSLAAQQRVADSAEKERIRDETLVQQSHESEQSQIERDGRRRNPFSGRRKQRPESRDEDDGAAYGAADKKKLSDEGGQHFDVTV
ncbi:MAG: hypothetical protein ACOX5J_18155 [Candidatus Hydrogenedentales bacterium]|jgi:hypothetical protein